MDAQSNTNSSVNQSSASQAPRNNGDQQRRKKDGSLQPTSQQSSMTNGSQSESALRNNKSGTISQQSTAQVQHQYSAHYTGGESSTSKRPQEMSALDRLKCIQNNFRQQWHGINCEISGRPGEY